MNTAYDKAPFVPAGDASGCAIGWEEICQVLRGRCSKQSILCVECYPGVDAEELADVLQARLRPTLLARSESVLRDPASIERMLAPVLTDDPVFGHMNEIGIEDFFDPVQAAAVRRNVAAAKGMVVIVGLGASLLAPEYDLLVYAELARWEIQQRQRRNKIGNLGANNRAERPGLKYKRAFFVDWRAADRLKRRLYEKIDYLLDANDPRCPKMITGVSYRQALERVVRRPFRVVPFFDPGPWGGQWMRRTCDLPGDAPNYAWCFDCVPEENSLLLEFGGALVEVPAIDLVFMQPRELLGEAVYARFGAEFPIRFDFLDTMGGGNLSMQVHPLTEYIQNRFGMRYTQDESYYLLDAGEDACVFLGLREGIEPSRMMQDLRAAQDGGSAFDAERFVNRWPARKHDHFLIPAGTVHCSGRNSMVLEISATPYIFTFKLWDWGRLGLDGEPRPVHLDHGEANIVWNRTATWVREQLINRIEPVSQGPEWREERTGLHQTQFIETRRHWFASEILHQASSGLNVLNLVEGEEAVVESPSSAFEHFTVHYAETFIVPAAAGPYRIRPSGASVGKTCATVKAFVRTHA